MLKDFSALCLKFVIPEPLKYKLISCFQKAVSHGEEQEVLMGTGVSPISQTGGSWCQTAQDVKVLEKKW